jgi:hypothetical protein
MMRTIAKLVIIAVVGLSLVFLTGTAFSAQVAGKTSTQNAPIQSSTQTAPLPSNTKTVPLPSTTREYQQVDKPPVKTLDIPDWDLAGELRNMRFHYVKVGPTYRKVFSGFKFKIALMNKGKLQGSKDIPVKVTVLNMTNNTLIKEENHVIRGQNIRNNMWELTPDILAKFVLCSKTASTVGDVKLIVDIDPQNTFKEARRHRGNNRCEAHW